MIRGSGVDKTSPYSQTPNGPEVKVHLKWNLTSIRVPSGPFLVSRNGETGWTERSDKAPDSPVKEN